MTFISSRLKNNLWFCYLCWLLLWALNAYGEIAKTLKDGTLFARVIGGHPYINDSVQLHSAALLAHRCAGGRIDIYDPAVQDQSLRALIEPIVPQTLQYLQYPPQFFALVQPFSVLSLQSAYFVWCGLALILILWTLWILCKDYFASAFARSFVFIATLGGYPAWLSFELGQTSLYQFPATIGFWLLLRAKRAFTAGLLSALLLVKLQYMPAMILIGLILGRGRYAAGLLLSSSVLAVLTVLTVGMDNILKYPSALQFGETNAQVGGVAANMMQNFRGEMIVLSFQDEHLIHQLSLALFAVGIIASVLLWVKLYPQMKKCLGEDAFGICAGISILVSLIFSPHTHIQEFLPASLAIVFLSPLLKNGPNKALNIILSVLMIGFPILSWLFFLFLPIFQMYKVQPYLFWDLALLLVSGLDIGRRLHATTSSDGQAVVLDGPTGDPAS